MLGDLGAEMDRDQTRRLGMPDATGGEPQGQALMAGKGGGNREADQAGAAQPACPVGDGGDPASRGAGQPAEAEGAGRRRIDRVRGPFGSHTVAVEDQRHRQNLAGMAGRERRVEPDGELDLARPTETGEQRHGPLLGERGTDIGAVDAHAEPGDRRQQRRSGGGEDKVDKRIAGRPERLVLVELDEARRSAVAPDEDRSRGAGRPGRLAEQGEQRAYHRVGHLIEDEQLLLEQEGEQLEQGDACVDRRVMRPAPARRGRDVAHRQPAQILKSEVVEGERRQGHDAASAAPPVR
jgi:hypothetical protein